MITYQWCRGPRSQSSTVQYSESTDSTPVWPPSPPCSPCSPCSPNSLRADGQSLPVAVVCRTPQPNVDKAARRLTSLPSTIHTPPKTRFSIFSIIVPLSVCQAIYQHHTEKSSSPKVQYRTVNRLDLYHGSTSHHESTSREPFGPLVLRCITICLCFSVSSKPARVRSQPYTSIIALLSLASSRRPSRLSQIGSHIDSTTLAESQHRRCLSRRRTICIITFPALGAFVDVFALCLQIIERR
jgi:hypothetical protein